MVNKYNIITTIVVCFVLLFIFALQFSNSKPHKNNSLNSKNLNKINTMNSSIQNNYKKVKSEPNSDSNIDIKSKSLPQSLYENKKNLEEIKNQMEIVKRKVNHMKQMREVANEKE